jgi:hypothetical protein
MLTASDARCAKDVTTAFFQGDWLFALLGVLGARGGSMNFDFAVLA